MHSKLATGKNSLKYVPTYPSHCWQTYIQVHTVCAHVCPPTANLEPGNKVSQISV